MKSKKDIITDIDLIVGCNREITDDTHMDLVDEISDYIENLILFGVVRQSEQLKEKEIPKFEDWLSTFDYERWFNDVRYLTENGYYNSDRMYDLYKKTFKINL